MRWLVITAGWLFFSSIALCGVVIGGALLIRPGLQITFESDLYQQIGTYNIFSTDIFVLDAATTNVINLTHHPAHDTSAAWSPDGTLMAFYSTREQGGRFVYVMSLDGQVRRVSADSVRFGFRPAWSPDSTRIAYEVDVGAQTDIHIVDVTQPLVTGVNPHILVNNRWDDRFPEWSPDGEHLVFVSWRDGNADIFSARADGEEMRNLTKYEGWDVSPSWSPDGTEIAFFSVRRRYRDLFVMNADGSNLRRLTDINELSAGYFWYAPAWSPDGTQIAIQTTIDRDPEIIVVAHDGSSQKRLTDAIRTDAQPIWLSDNEHLLFMSDRAGRYGVYITGWQNGITRRLSPSNIGASYPATWSAK